MEPPAGVQTLRSRFEALAAAESGPSTTPAAALRPPPPLPRSRPALHTTPASSPSPSPSPSPATPALAPPPSPRPLGPRSPASASTPTQRERPPPPPPPPRLPSPLARLHSTHPPETPPRPRPPPSPVLTSAAPPVVAKRRPPPPPVALVDRTLGTRRDDFALPILSPAIDAAAIRRYVPGLGLTVAGDGADAAPAVSPASPFDDDAPTSPAPSPHIDCAVPPSWSSSAGSSPPTHLVASPISPRFAPAGVDFFALSDHEQQRSPMGSLSGPHHAFFSQAMDRDVGHSAPPVPQRPNASRAASAAPQSLKMSTKSRHESIGGGSHFSQTRSARSHSLTNVVPPGYYNDARGASAAGSASLLHPPPPLPDRSPVSPSRSQGLLSLGPMLGIPPPPIRVANHGMPANAPSGASAPTTRTPSVNGEDSDDDDDAAGGPVVRPDDMPDATFANRRPPHLDPPRLLQLGTQFSAFALRGRHLITAHYQVRLYNAGSGTAVGGAGTFGMMEPWLSTSSTSGNIEPSFVTTGLGDIKITSMQFRGSSLDDQPLQDIHNSNAQSSATQSSMVSPRCVWCGMKDGSMFEFDCEAKRIVDSRSNLHSSPIVGIFRGRRGGMMSLDESGKCHIWSEESGLPPPPPGQHAHPIWVARMSLPSRVQRVHDKTNWSGMLGHQLWTASGPSSHKSAGSLAARSPMIRIYDPDPSRAWTVNPRPMAVLDSSGQVGCVTAGAVMPALGSSQVFLSHDTGHISVWSKDYLSSTHTTNTHVNGHLNSTPMVVTTSQEAWSCTAVHKVSHFPITALEGVHKYLWAGYKSGMVYVYDVEALPWKVVKVWKAHKDGVTRIIVDPSLLWHDSIGKLHVATTSSDWSVHVWDGFLGSDWIASEMKKRESEFCTYRPLRVLIASWNIDASRPSDLVGTTDNVHFLSNVLKSVESPDVIVFGFQEMIDLENKKLTAKTLLWGGRKKGAEKLSDSVTDAYRQWLDKLTLAVRTTLPSSDPYVVVHTKNLVGLFSCVFVKESERRTMRDVAITTVKTGMKGRYGNKGAIVARLVVDDSSICFINCHLTAGQKHVRRRHANLIDILEEKSAFPDPTPVIQSSRNQTNTSSLLAYVGGGNGTSVLDHEICFLQGDLNYRIDEKRDEVIKAVASGEYLRLLPLDQLVKEKKFNPAFRLKSFTEAPVSFWPTYKYDPGTDMYDSSEKSRIPAWCDRILYRTSTCNTTSNNPSSGSGIDALHYQRYEVNVSDHRPISGAYDVKIKCIVPGLRRNILQESIHRWMTYEQEVKKSARLYYSKM